MAQHGPHVSAVQKHECAHTQHAHECVHGSGNFSPSIPTEHHSLRLSTCLTSISLFLPPSPFLPPLAPPYLSLPHILLFGAVTMLWIVSLVTEGFAKDLRLD